MEEGIKQGAKPGWPAILEYTGDTWKGNGYWKIYWKKAYFFLDILEKNILEFGISKFDTGIYWKWIHPDHTSIWIRVMLNEIEIMFI